MVYGALCAMAQKDFKSLVAYSSISHMGYVLLGLAALTDQGIQGAALQMLNHGVSSAMMFLLVGIVYERAHHRDLDNFGGMGLQMPYYTGFATIGFFASLGLPGLNGFISEFLVFQGAFSSQAFWAGSSVVYGLPRWIVYAALPGDRADRGLHPLDDPAGVPRQPEEGGVQALPGPQPARDAHADPARGPVHLDGRAAPDRARAT